MSGMHPGAADDGILEVTVDGERCQGHNRCMVHCPEVFEADGFGYAVVKTPRVGLDLEAKVRLAEANCPERAITVT